MDTIKMIDHALKWVPSIRNSIKQAYYNTGATDEKQEVLASKTIEAALTVLQKMASGDDWLNPKHAPTCGQEFIALDENGSIYHACYDKYDRLCYKNHWTATTNKGTSYFHNWTLMCEQGFIPKLAGWKHIDQAKHVAMLMEQEMKDE